MAKQPISEDRLREVARLYEEHGSASAAGRAEGTSERSMRYQVAQAMKRGYIHSTFDPVPPGFEVREQNISFDKQGVEKGRRVTIVQESGGPFSVPDGHFLKGVSSYLDADGNVRGEWRKTNVETEHQFKMLVKAYSDAIERYAGHAVLPPAPSYTDSELLTAYPIADHHLGLYAWHEEAGEDYDIERGRDVLMNAVGDLVAVVPESETALVLDLGDFLHGDDSTNQTRRSSNALDIDSRYAKVLTIGLELKIAVIELALQKHDRVIVRELPGNHNDDSSYMIALALAAHFRNNDRVEVSLDPSRHYAMQHGRVLIVATHGDQVKPEEFPGMVAANWPEEWGATKFRYGMFGHIHHKLKIGGEKYGITCEAFNTLAPRDAWAAGRGLTANKTMCAVTYHAEHGEIARSTITARF